MDKIRVAQVIGTAKAGGVESMIMNLYQNIDRSHVTFDFFVENTCPIIDEDKIKELGGDVIIIPHYANVFKYVRTLKKLFIKGKYDIVHSNMNALSVFTLLAAKKAKVKVRIAHSHSTANKKEWLKTLIKNILRPFSKKYATHLFACSELSARWLFGNKAVDDKKVIIINNAIDLTRFAPDNNKRVEIRNKLNINNNDLVIGNIGRFVPQKNHAFLIDIFKKIKQINPSSKLLLIGDGPYLDKIKQKVEKLKLTKEVLFIGAVKNTELYYQAMDNFVLPSIYEGLPVVGIEAQAMGLNVFFSKNITGEVQVNKNVYFLSLKQSADTWASQIVNCLPSNRIQNHENMLKSKYDIKVEGNKLLKIYKEILE